MILLAETPVKYRDGTVKSLDELGGEAKELAPDTPVVNGSTSKPLDEFIQDQIVLSPDTVVVDGEDTTTLEDFIEDNIPQIRTNLYQNTFNVSIDNNGEGVIDLSEVQIQHWEDYDEIKIFIRFYSNGDEYLIDFDILKLILYQYGTTFLVKTDNYTSGSALMSIMIALDSYDGTGESGEFEITFRNHPDTSETISVGVCIIGC